MREGLQAYRAALGDDTLPVLGSQARLGHVLTDLGRYAEADSLMVHSAGRLEAQSGLADRHTQEAVHYLVELYEAWGRPEQAAAWRVKLDAPD